jgi:glycosyltransferase involved in cell wall biosynthesis
MASGLPVVATNVGGATELVEDGVTGRLIRAEDSSALAAALMDLASNPSLRERMGRAGRVKAEQEFGLQRMLRDYERVYVELAEAPAGDRLA